MLMYKDIYNSSCTKCEHLCSYANSICVSGRGDVHSDILIIGQNPGKEEDKSGFPFVGKAGRLLEEALVTADLKSFAFAGAYDKDNLCSGPFITNVVKCGSPDNRPPSVEEINNCLDYLKKEIELVKPKLIIALGNHAQYPFTGRVTGITRLRGKVMETEYGRVMFTYHPAAILYDVTGAKVKDFESDLSRVKSLINDSSSPQRSVDIDYTVVKSEDELIKLATILNSKSYYAVDIETNGLNVHRPDPKIVCISIAFQNDHGYVIWLPAFEDQSRVWDILRGPLESKDSHKILANAKFDAKWIKELTGIDTSSFDLDIILAHHLVDPGSRRHSLKYQAGIYFGDGHYDTAVSDEKERVEEEYRKFVAAAKKAQSHIDKAKKRLRELEEDGGGRKEYLVDKWKETLRQEKTKLDTFSELVHIFEEKVQDGFFGVSMDFLAPYAVKDAVYTWRLFLILMKDIVRKDALGVFKLSSAFIKVLVDAELYGIKYNMGTAKGVLESYEAKEHLARVELSELEQVKSLIEARGWKKFNPNSVKHLHALFFETLKMESFKTTGKGNPSYSKDVLEVWASESKEAALIVDIRHLVKMQSTYLKGYMDAVEESGGRYYPDYNNVGTISGRMSSGFHTIPKTKEDLSLRLPFESSFEGGYLVEMDESQLELRVAAYLYNDKNMIQVYKDGADIHSRTAARIFGIDEADVDRKKHRQPAKALNFSILYGIYPESLSKKLERYTGDFYDPREAADFIREWLNFFPEIKKGIISKVLSYTQSDGDYEIRTIFGRGIDMSRARGLELEKAAEYSYKYSNSEFYRLSKRAYDCPPFTYTQRLTLNFPVQSTSSDIVICGAIKLYEDCRDLGMKSRIIGMVHDSILVDVPPEEIYDLVELGRNALTYPPIKRFFPQVNFDIPLDVGVAIGRNLGSTIEIEDVLTEENKEQLEGIQLEPRKLFDILHKA